MEIGMTIVLEVIGLDKEIEKYRSKIIEKNDNYIVTDYPINISNNKTAFLPIGTNVRISYTKKNAVYQFNSEIVTKIKSKIPALAIPIPENTKIIRIQRRAFVRIESSVDVAIHSLNESFLPFTSVTKDISGGGLSVIVQNRDDIRIGDRVKVYMALPTLSGEYFYIIVEAEIVFIKSHNNIHSASLKFLNISKQDQQHIIQYCFDKERELRNKGFKE